MRTIAARRQKRLLGMFFLFLPLMAGIRCGHGPDRTPDELPVQGGVSSQGEVIVTADLDLDFSQHNVTFIELGADRCIPCRKMQPIMREIAAEYTRKVQVIFYDVWKDPRPARKYGIQLIPTQVFIDRNGHEIFRHVGLFPKAEILKMLREKGIL